MNNFKSSSFKVGILTLVALIILIFAILWVQGRAFSSAERIEVHFRDVNGMRTGSGVQMMGLRVGQVEEIVPVVDGEKSYVKIKFVITAPNIKIPKASAISIQQSGIIGEQFLEITPPRTRVVYIPANNKSLLYKDDIVEMKLDNKMYDVGYVKDARIMSTKLIPMPDRGRIKTDYAYKIDYVVNLPGLRLPEFIKGEIAGKKLRITPLDNVLIPYPKQDSPYTILEPMRLSQFLDLQYKAAESLTVTNQKINDLLSDKLIADLKQSVVNMNALTAQATTTMAKAEKLIDSSNKDLDNMMKMLDSFTKNFDTLTKIVDNVAGDPQFKPTFYDATKVLTQLTNNLNKVLDNADAAKLGADLNAIVSNVNEISSFVNTMTKDKKLQDKVLTAVDNVNKAMVDLSNALEVVNSMTPKQKEELNETLNNVSATACNLRKFTEKLNKRFLLFRLMF